MNDASSIMIDLKQVSKTYRFGKREISALTGIDLQVRRGEIYGIIGRSGAGKSTLIRCVNLLERPTEGAVTVDGQDLMRLSSAQLREARRHMGMVFQHFCLLSRRTVYDNVAFPLTLMKKSHSEIEAAVMPLLERIGMLDWKSSYPSQLSGGQKQRVAIARALVTQPKILLCDEMTSALDPETTQSIIELIKSLQTEYELTILLITHEMEVIKRLADRVSVIDRGRVVEEATLVDLFKQPKTPEARQLTQTTLHTELPVSIMNQLQATWLPGGWAVWRIAFVGGRAAEPIISTLVHQCAVSINIWQSTLEWLRHEMFGVMVMGVQGSFDELNQARQYLVAQGLSVEEMGYVQFDRV